MYCDWRFAVKDIVEVVPLNHWPKGLSCQEGSSLQSLVTAIHGDDSPSMVMPDGQQ